MSNRSLPPEGFPYYINCGAIETMQKVAQAGKKMLNPATHKWQIVSKTAKYMVVRDEAPAVSEEYGEQWGADLFSDQDLYAIGRDKGLI